MENQPPETITINLQLLHTLVCGEIPRNVVGGANGCEISTLKDGAILARAGKDFYLCAVGTMARLISEALLTEERARAEGGLTLTALECEMVKSLQEYKPGTTAEFIDLCQSNPFKSQGWDNSNSPARLECQTKLERLGLLDPS